MNVNEEVCLFVVLPVGGMLTSGLHCNISNLSLFCLSIIDIIPLIHYHLIPLVWVSTTASVFTFPR